MTEPGFIYDGTDYLSLSNLVKPHHLSEKEIAVVLANKILDRFNADPDDDLAILSRQLLRSLERESALNQTISELRQR